MKKNILVITAIVLLSNHCKIFAQDERPNILWISCEDRSPRLGFYGDEVAQTPNLDMLAKEGMRFTNVISTVNYHLEWWHIDDGIWQDEMTIKTNGEGLLAMPGVPNGEIRGWAFRISNLD